MMDQIVVEGVFYLYPNGKGIRDLSFTAGEGELLCISGTNGSGKTTLLRVLSTVYPPQKGAVLIGGNDVVRRKDLVRQSIFPVFDENAHMGFATGRENLEFFMNLYGSRSWDQIEHYTRHFGLDLEIPVDEFSRGMKRKLLLMESLLSGKKVLLFDEPTLGLDTGTRHVFFRFLEELSENGSTIIFGTNRKDETAHAGRIVHIEAGEVSPTPPEKDPGGMIEIRVVMDTDEFSEFVVSAEEIPGVIARVLPLGVPRRIEIRPPGDHDQVWTDAALEKVQRAPPLVRRMVLRIVERYARDQGYHRIPPEVVDEAKGRFEPR